MRVRLLLAVSLLSLTGCTEAGPMLIDDRVGIYLDAGSTQCQDDGITLEKMQEQLSAADIAFTGSACGTDGNMYMAMCGSPDGRIGMFEIAPHDLQQARALGFEALANVPEAAAVDCSQW